MKHLHHLLVLAILLLTVPTANASARVAHFHYKQDGNEYCCDGYDDGTASAWVYRLNTPDLVVPSTVVYGFYGANDDIISVEGIYTLTEISGVLNNNDLLKSIILPASVHTISERAFEYCSALTNVSCPNVQTIGDGAF